MTWRVLRVLELVLGEPVSGVWRRLPGIVVDNMLFNSRLRLNSVVINGLYP